MEIAATTQLDVDETTPDASPTEGASATDVQNIDLDRVERDLDDVQAALVRLNDGQYWTDEVTGDVLPDALLADNPTARTATSSH